ncbi:hypothetical protein WDU94_003480 [Cyamophila willieti]
MERPYRCAYCIKSFKQQAHLKQHMRIHSDEKPYECSYCGRRFRQRAVLNQHVRLHTGEKPYVCVQCGNAFRQLTNLKSHLNTCTGDNSGACLIPHAVWDTKDGEARAPSKPKRGRKSQPQNQYIKIPDATEKVHQWLKSEPNQSLSHDLSTNNSSGDADPSVAGTSSSSLWSKAMSLDTAKQSLQQHWNATGAKDLANSISGVALWEHTRLLQQQQQSQQQEEDR